MAITAPLDLACKQPGCTKKEEKKVLLYEFQTRNADRVMEGSRLNVLHETCYEKLQRMCDTHLQWARKDISPDHPGLEIYAKDLTGHAVCDGLAAARGENCCYVHLGQHPFYQAHILFDAATAEQARTRYYSYALPNRRQYAQHAEAPRVAAKDAQPGDSRGFCSIPQSAKTAVAKPGEHAPPSKPAATPSLPSPPPNSPSSLFGSVDGASSRCHDNDDDDSSSTLKAHGNSSSGESTIGEEISNEDNVDEHSAHGYDDDKLEANDVAHRFVYIRGMRY